MTGGVVPVFSRASTSFSELLGDLSALNALEASRAILVFCPYLRRAKR